jgi:hypothetical protein
MSKKQAYQSASWSSKYSIVWKILIPESIATYRKVIKVRIVVSTVCGADYFKIRKSSTT